MKLTILSLTLGVHAALPVVDLGYIKQQALSLTDGYYTFSNIPFAQPPLGDLRFAAPASPKKVAGVRNGNRTSPVCPQAYPPWLAEVFGSPGPIPQDLSNSEDCLYLDVFVPKSLFEPGKAPVLDLIYGGGLVIGSKTTNNPRGLLLRSMNNSDGMIIVAANYRLGNFGTLGGKDFEAQGGPSNVALLDQRKVIDWIQKYIHLFGGDRKKVTLMGESGGASSIAHQITGAAALGGLALSQVVMQSPAEVLPLTNELANKQFHDFLKAANVSTLAEARKLDTAVLQRANYQLIQAFPSGVFPYTYTVDGRIVKESARRSLLHQCAHDLSAIVSYNLDEKSIFVPHDGTFEQYVQQWAPSLRADQVQALAQLYPASAFASLSSRIDAFIGDALIDCNATAYHRAFDNKAYAYRFSVPVLRMMGMACRVC